MNKFFLITLIVFLFLLFVSSNNSEHRLYKTQSDLIELYKQENELYKSEMKKGNCIESTDYVHSEKYNREIEIIKFVKCTELNK